MATEKQCTTSGYPLPGDAGRLVGGAVGGGGVTSADAHLGPCETHASKEGAGGLEVAGCGPGPSARHGGGYTRPCCAPRLQAVTHPL
ncbi:hypothetical protein NDU88_007413 [Pleurodeles waltl]|uniref:Uncharacterized protein n=1 Tax=Pleurodeles waltl TaxID=8319 RepID=A0AAV7SS81_PLEWA|nr:hypothetical protein NDU88_007413 [Pleurodeles waltl]